MKHIRYVLMFLLTFLFCVIIASPVSAKEDLPAIVSKIKPSVVVILTYDENGDSLFMGSGFFISKEGDVITNYHVLEGASSGEIITEKGKVFPVIGVLAADIVGDLIRLSVDIPRNEVHSLVISTSIPKEGESIAVIGNPLGLLQTVTKGIVSAVRYVPGFGSIIQIDAAISSGSSGSPVVNMKGEVIGVATLSIIEGQNLNFAIPGKRILELNRAQEYPITELGYEESSTEPCASAHERWERWEHYFSLSKKGDYEAALVWLEDVLKKNPNDCEALYAISECYDNLGEKEKAIKGRYDAIACYEKAGYCTGYWDQALIYEYLEKKEETIIAYKNAISCFQETVRENPENCGTYVEMAMCYGDFEQWDDKVRAYEQALSCYEKAARENPNNCDCYLEIASINSILGRKEETIKTYEQVVRIDPDNYDVYLSLSDLYRSQKSPLRAVAILKQAINIDPNNDRAYTELGDLYIWLGRYTEAFESLQQAILVNPNNDWTYEMLGTIYDTLGQYNMAIDCFKQAIKIDPEGYRSYRYLAELYSKIGRHEDAIETHKQFICIETGDVDYTYVLIGKEYYKLENYWKAVEAFKQAININPDNYWANLNMGYAYDELKQYKKAIESYKQAILIRPDYAYAHYRLGIVYCILGENSSALKQYNKLTTLNKDLANALKVSLKDKGMLSEKKQPLKKFQYDFRKTKWGMSMEQVKKTEESPVIYEGWSKGDNANILYYEATVAYMLMDCGINYKFHENRLTSATCFFTPEYTNDNNCFKDFERVSNKLTSKYGAQTSERHEGWLNEQYKSDPNKWGYAVRVHHLMVGSSWESITTSIHLLLVNVDNNIVIQISYISKNEKGKTFDDF